LKPALLAHRLDAGLLIFAMADSLANPLLHHVWFFLNGDTQNIAGRFFAMFVRDLSCALITLYVAKGALSLIPLALPTASNAIAEAAVL
jgi:hypothetical protein